MSATQHSNPDLIDSEVQSQVVECLLATPPKSFFLFAGAGSGKTRSLVIALNALRAKRSKQFRLAGQQVGVITYTNAACDEIKRRVGFDPLFEVRTIHSFVWELIRGFDDDIRGYLSSSLKAEIAELNAEISKGRPGTKIAIERQRSLESKQNRLARLPSIHRFIYSPTGDNRERDALNHSEVVKIAAVFLESKPLMRRLLICKFPILLIDESQDTSKAFVEALLQLQANHRTEFAIGLFGDMMQRIYSDGKPDLGVGIPEDWATPALSMNHRSSSRIVRLINDIRKHADGRTQVARPDRGTGVARLFICAQGSSDKQALEMRARARMAEVCDEPLWNDPEQVKTLILEHLMAARRMDFVDLFEPLYRIDRFKTGLLDGSLPALRFFTEQVLPLGNALRDGDHFAVAAIVRRSSPLLVEVTSRTTEEEQQSRLKAADAAVRDLGTLLSKEPTLREVLKCVKDSRLLSIPEVLTPFAADTSKTADGATDESASDPQDEIARLAQFVEAPFEQVDRYRRYVSREAAFDTHQGVKGLEFPRVLVVIDDDEAAGFSFAYDKLFGAKDRTKADIENERAGKETGIDRTRRLFYVTCSRSQQSLAIIAHTSNPAAVQRYALENGWFEQSEVELMDIRPSTKS